MNGTAVLAALEGVLEMQRTIQRGGADISVETGLVFLGIHYRKLPAPVARRLTEIEAEAVAEIPNITGGKGSREERAALGGRVASAAAMAQTERAVNYYRDRLRLEAKDGTEGRRRE